MGGLPCSVYIRADGYNPRRSPHRICTSADLSAPWAHKVRDCSAAATDIPCRRAKLVDVVSPIGGGLEMQRKNLKLLLAAAPLALAVAAPALAADMSVKAPRYKAPITMPYSWTGWYLGANAGYGVGTQEGNLAISATGIGLNVGAPFNGLPGGGFGGGQLGYNYQRSGNIVLGVETDIQGAGITDTRTCLFGCVAGNSAIITDKLNWFGTTRARAGLATGPVLTYVTGGAAYGETQTGLSTSILGIGTSALTMNETKG